MVETRSRRKSTAPGAAADGTPASSGHAGGGGETTSGRHPAEPHADGGDSSHTDYAEMYRQADLKAKRAEQSSLLRRLKGQAYLFYHQQAMTWGWYMLDPWETVLWMSFLAFLSWMVLSACFINPNSICSSGLAAARKALAAQGAKLLAYRG